MQIHQKSPTRCSIMVADGENVPTRARNTVSDGENVPARTRNRVSDDENVPARTRNRVSDDEIVLARARFRVSDGQRPCSAASSGFSARGAQASAGAAVVSGSTGGTSPPSSFLPCLRPVGSKRLLRRRALRLQFGQPPVDECDEREVERHVVLRVGIVSDLHSCCFFDVNTLVFVSKFRCVRGSVAGSRGLCPSFSLCRSPSFLVWWFFIRFVLRSYKKSCEKTSAKPEKRSPRAKV